SSARRDVRLLSGRALFEVAHNAARPFAVAALDRFVTATGTVYVVSVGSGAMSTTLAQGRIVVSDSGDDQTVTLAPGQQYALEPGQAPVLRNVDLAAALAWRDGYLQFDDVPLAEAVDQINRTSQIKLKLGDAAAGALRISGRFKGGDAARFAETLALIYP